MLHYKQKLHLPNTYIQSNNNNYTYKLVLTWKNKSSSKAFVLVYRKSDNTKINVLT